LPVIEEMMRPLSTFNSASVSVLRKEIAILLLMTRFPLSGVGRMTNNRDAVCKGDVSHPETPDRLARQDGWVLGNSGLFSGKPERVCRKSGWLFQEQAWAGEKQAGFFANGTGFAATQTVAFTDPVRIGAEPA
jgi:hypothetical protein